MRRPYGILLAIALIPGLVATTSSAATDTAGDRIAFSRGGDIFTVRPDGSDLKRVTDNAASEEAVWSPDGNKLAVTKISCGELRCLSWITVMDPDGSDPLRITRRVIGWARVPAWSPDGREIAFVDWIDGFQSPNPSAIKIARTDGSGQRRLTGFAGWNFSPSWSPDGTEIAFESYRDGDDEIYVVDRDGSDLRRLTDNEVDDMGPAWGPDGTAIAFTTRATPDDSDAGPMSPPKQAINLAAADGTGTVELLPATEINWFSSWSPDGGRILFRRTVLDDAGSTTGEMLMSISVGDREITELGLAGYSSTWSGDGTQVAFERDGHIFVVPSGGGDPIQITSGKPQNSTPRWRPR